MPKKRKLEDIVRLANEKHKNFYNYSKLVYINNEVKVIIICPKHGEFKQKVGHHLHGQGCPKCGGKQKYTLKEFILRANQTHNYKYDYNLIKEYIHCTSKVPVLCKIHGEFNQTPDMHIKGNGCPKCGSLQRPKSKTKKQVTFLNQAIKMHGNYYDYSKSIYQRHNKKIEITCPIHGSFFQTPHNHIRGNGCSTCVKSRGHKKIFLFLKENNINFTEEYTFKECVNPKTNYKLRFDFYLPEYNLCIEYDGIQHYSTNSFFGDLEMVKYNQYKDKIKTDFCLDKNINLLRIPYYEEPNISNILTKKINNDKSKQ